MNDKIRGNSFGNTRERQLSGKSSVNFRITFGKFKINRKPWKNDLDHIFVKKFRKFSVDFWNIFVLPCNKLFISRIAPAVP